MPERPECFEFAMDFLGDPEATEVRAYVESLENPWRPVESDPPDVNDPEVLWAAGEPTDVHIIYDHYEHILRGDVVLICPPEIEGHGLWAPIPSLPENYRNG